MDRPTRAAKLAEIWKQVPMLVFFLSAWKTVCTVTSPTTLSPPSLRTDYPQDTCTIVTKHLSNFNMTVSPCT